MGYRKCEVSIIPSNTLLPVISSWYSRVSSLTGFVIRTRSLLPTSSLWALRIISVLLSSISRYLWGRDPPSTSQVTAASSPENWTLTAIS
ncbi:hypothetical protein GDO78_019789 [Eleutherodactylus coqui]|uniref:Uncharacterized protein n=1 Tax=Eleutherodactylus coqui TaxID=57060 RepID=A0A8J6BGF6_ELECQ|nr:hypothetical protein GDO78_019789 [Eleutherodactylus coqui]